MEYLLIIVAFLILYSFLGYPLTFFFLAATFRKKKKPEEIPDVLPSVMLIFPCCWEGKRLWAKIENCAQIDYPSEKLIVVAVADGPTPETLAVLRKAERKGLLRVLVNPVRSGKGVALSIAHGQCDSEIFAVTDADTMLQPQHLKQLLAPFADPEVGATTGTFYYGNVGETGISRNEGIYWRFEMLTRKAETLMGRSITVTGAVYAIRTALFHPDDPLSPDDFLAGVQTLERRKKVLFLDKIVACDYSASSGSAVFKRRVRTITRGLGLLARNPRYISPFHFPLLAWQIFNHKIVRWMLPVLLLLIFTANLVLAFSGVLWLVLLLAQALFYAAGLVGGMLLKYKHKVPIASSIWYFLVSCAASLAAIWNFVTGKKFAVWSQTARK